MFTPRRYEGILCGEEIYKEVATVIDEYDYLRYENKLKNKIYN